MNDTIGNRLLKNITPSNKPFEVRDTQLKGFILRVQPSGSMSYICEHGRGRRITIGKTSILTPAQARDKAKEILANTTLGNSPVEKGSKQNISLKQFITDIYGPWALTHRKTGKQKIKRIESCFNTLLTKDLNNITIIDVERWRSKRLNENIEATTVNRDINDLKACLSKAKEWDKIANNPIAALKPLKTDKNKRVRYLDTDEEKRLRKTLDQKETEAKDGRTRANKWRRVRKYKLLPDLEKQVYAGRLKPMALLSINTGIRRGELFNLTWDNVDLERDILTIEGASSKNNTTRHIPLNTEAHDVLSDWKAQSSTAIVFPNKNGKRLNSIKTTWKNLLKDAKIHNCRWHDLRHHFASRLVMKGVDLNTVRELLGHADIKMTLRYAHLSPGFKAEAVAKLLVDKED